MKLWWSGAIIGSLTTNDGIEQGFMLKEKFGLFVDFEFLTKMGPWGTD